MSTGGRVGSRLRVANFDPAAKLSHRHTERYQNDSCQAAGVLPCWTRVRSQ